MLTGSIKEYPTTRQLRHFAWLLALVLVFAAWRLGPERPAVGVVLGAAIIFALGMLRPDWVRWVYLPLVAVTRPVGWLAGHVLLALFYFGLLTPLALVFRLLGRDALALRLEPQAPTYWEPHQQTSDPRGYFHPF